MNRQGWYQSRYQGSNGGGGIFGKHYDINSQYLFMLPFTNNYTIRTSWFLPGGASYEKYYEFVFEPPKLPYDANIEESRQEVNKSLIYGYFLQFGNSTHQEYRTSPSILELEVDNTNLNPNFFQWFQSLDDLKSETLGRPLPFTFYRIKGIWTSESWLSHLFDYMDLNIFYNNENTKEINYNSYVYCDIPWFNSRGVLWGETTINQSTPFYQYINTTHIGKTLTINVEYTRIVGLNVTHSTEILYSGKITNEMLNQPYAKDINNSTIMIIKNSRIYLYQKSSMKAITSSFDSRTNVIYPPRGNNYYPTSNTDTLDSFCCIYSSDSVNTPCFTSGITFNIA